MLGFWKTRRGAATGAAVVIACFLMLLFGMSARLRPLLGWPLSNGSTESVALMPMRDPVEVESPAGQAHVTGQVATPAEDPTLGEGSKVAGADVAPDRAKPSFDVVRVEPSGESVIAARGIPNADVVLLDGDKTLARARTDADGQVAFVPPVLTPGNHSLTLSLTTPATGKTVASQSVVVSVPPPGGSAPLVAKIQPKQLAKTLSGPIAGNTGVNDRGETPVNRSSTAAIGMPVSTDATAASTLVNGASVVRAETSGSPASGQDAMAIRSVEIEDMGSFYASGKGSPGHPCRIYLNGSFVATVTPDGNGVWSLQIKRGMKPGRYAVRVDQVDAGSGKVVARAEVPFDYPRSARASLRKGQQAQRTPIAVGSLATMISESPAKGATGAGPRDVLANTATVSASNAAVVGQDLPAAGPKTAAPDARIATMVVPNPSSTLSVAAPSSGIVADLLTAKVNMGDSLWRISRKMLGHGIRYTQIYAANTTQIRDPKLIYPGQVFVMPQTERP